MLQVARCQKCDSLVKPDIVFFGESLPARFFTCSAHDMPQCDLLIIMGTSLVVYPFAALQSKVTDRCPRLLVNREKVGELDFGENNLRDALHLGDCDDGVSRLAELLGWAAELEALQIPQAAPEATATAAPEAEE
jgi:NAD+-dependent protein deacetylase sirtuin 2